MFYSAPTETSQDAIVSCNTALACLAFLSAQYSTVTEIKVVNWQNEYNNNTLSIPKFIEIANGIGFEAHFVDRDWKWLQPAVIAQPILLLLNNTNVIVAVGSRFDLTEEIFVSDPLHRDGDVFILSRQDLERAWDGSALLITPQLRPSEIASEKGKVEASVLPRSPERMPPEREAQSVMLTRHLLRGMPLNLRVGIALCPVAAVLVATVLLVGQSERKAAPLSSPVPAGRALGKVLQPALSIKDAGLRGLVAGALKNLLVAPIPPAARMINQSELTTVTAGPAVLPPTMLADAVVPPAEPVAIAMVVPPPATPEPTQRDGPAPAALSAVEIAVLLERGDEYFGRSDVVSARLFYQRAADAGLAIAALRMGETFDPTFLDRAHLRGVSGDLDAAVSWYRRARDLGSSDAEILLIKGEVN